MRCASCGHEFLSPRETCDRCGAAITTSLARPWPVTLLGIAQMVGGILTLLAAIGLGVLVAGLAAVAEEGALAAYAGVALVAALALVQIAWAVGLLRMRSYGRTLSIIAGVIQLIAIPLGTIMGILTLVYMLKPGMRVLFSNRSPDTLFPNEIAEVEEARKSTAGNVLGILAGLSLALLLVVGIVLAISGAALGTMIVGALAGKGVTPGVVGSAEGDPVNRTLADMRSASLHLTSYSIDHDSFPEATDVEALARLVEPTYVKQFPRTDAWGNPFSYRAWPPSSSPAGSEYALASAGADGVFEHEDLGDYQPGPTASADDDLVITSEGFLRAPPGAVGVVSWPPTGQGTAAAEAAPAAPRLNVMDWRLRADKGRAIVEGSVVNLSSVTITEATLSATFLGDQGDELAAEEVPLEPLEPSKPVFFSVSVPLSPAMLTATLTIRDADGNELAKAGFEEPPPPEPSVPTEPLVEDVPVEAEEETTWDESETPAPPE